MDQLNNLSIQEETISPLPALPDGDPQLIYHSANTTIYSLNDIGYKVLNNCPSDEAFIKLTHEQNMSQSLPASCNTRQVMDVTNFNYRPALTFKWANGITLKEWLHNYPASHPLSIRLRAGMAIAKSLSVFHDAGFTYNSLTPENIVLSPLEGNYICTLMDLSKCIDHRVDNNQVDTAIIKELKVADLHCLGMVLDQLFRGEEGITLPDGTIHKDYAPEDNNNNNNNNELEAVQSASRRRKRQDTQNGYENDGLPFYLGSLISALIRPLDTEFCYDSAHDVFIDLQTMAENTNGCYLKSELDDSTTNSRLNLHDNMLFYGREVQLEKLMHLLTKLTTSGSKPLMGTICGYSGTG